MQALKEEIPENSKYLLFHESNFHKNYTIYYKQRFSLRCIWQSNLYERNRVEYDGHVKHSFCCQSRSLIKFPYATEDRFLFSRETKSTLHTRKTWIFLELKTRTLCEISDKSVAVGPSWKRPFRTFHSFLRPSVGIDMALKYHIVFDSIREIIRIIEKEQLLKDERPVTTFNPSLRPGDVFIVLSITFTAAALRYFLQIKLLPLWFSKFSRIRRRKICENIFYTVFYIFSFWYGVIVITKENWTVDPREAIIREFWTPFPVPMSSLFRSYYLMEAGYYCGALLFLSFDTKRSDFMEFVIHHSSTIFLVLISYIFGYVRVGLYILCLHDASDILLYLAKVLYYVRWNADVYVFSFFVIVFYLTR